MSVVRKLLGALPDRQPLPRPRAGEAGRTLAWSIATVLALTYMTIMLAAAWPGA